MCDLFGSAGADAAQQQIYMMQAQQAKHDQAVQQGKGEIDKAFAQFDPKYFANYRKSYTDAYDPQLREQYGIAKDQLTSSLADRDILQSTVGANAFGQLDKALNTNEAQIGNSAVDAENALKANVNNTKTQLYSLNTQAADPYAIGSQAQASAGTIVPPQNMGTLGNVFSGVLQGLGGAAKSSSQSMAGLPTQGWPGAAPIGGAGSGVYG